MSKTLRTRMVKEISKKLKGVPSGVLVEYKGLPAGFADSLRKELRAFNVEMDVLKNSLAKLAFKEIGLDRLSGELNGMVALVHGPDAALTAKKLLAWKEKNKKLQIRSGFLGKDILSAAQVKQLSDLPDRHTLLTQIACAIASPMVGFATAGKALTQNMAQLLKALEEKKSKEGPAAPAQA